MTQSDTDFLYQLTLFYYSNLVERFFEIGFFVLFFIVVLKFYKNLKLYNYFSLITSFLALSIVLLKEFLFSAIIFLFVSFSENSLEKIFMLVPIFAYLMACLACIGLLKDISGNKKTVNNKQNVAYGSSDAFSMRPFGGRYISEE